MDPVYLQFIDRYGPLGLVLVSVIIGLLIPRIHHDTIVGLYRENNDALKEQNGLLKDQVSDLVQQRDEIARDRDRLKTLFDAAATQAEQAMKALTRQGAGDDR